MSGTSGPELTGMEIAIIGLAGRFPGAGDVGELWRNLSAGVESIRQYSSEELLAAGVSAETLARDDYVKAGGHLDGADLFDAAFFGFQPREAQITDPQHRLFLECAWEALETAGYDPRTFPGMIGVYAGSGTNFYVFNVYSNPEILEAIGEYQVVLSVDKDHLATRVAYKLGLTGPGVTVQTACSTSLVSVHLACQALLAGECELALAGGVAVSGRDKAGYVYRQGDIRSPDGHCRAFDADAAGTVTGNGLGIVVLKRLEDALADGDAIQAVIKATAINNDGRGKIGYTAPSSDGQARVIRAAWELAEVDPATAGYIEAHGTGTHLGDPIEIAALTRVFADRGAAAESVALGSIKTNIGHLDVAAGVAGLIKTVLALKHRQLPPSLHFKAPNPQIDFTAGPFYVNTELRDWPAGDAPRRAGVSSFGIGGTNAHAVLEEAPPRAPSGPSRAWQLLLFSARSRTALEAMTDRLASHLAVCTEDDLADVAYTLRLGRSRFEERRALVCRDRDEALELLAGRRPERVFSRRQKEVDRPVAFLFPGQGAQVPNMARRLYDAEPVVRRSLDHAAEVLRPELGRDLREVLWSDADSARRELAETSLAQPALFAVELAVAELWLSWGIVPELMVGHSLGEYVAATLAGVFDRDDALRLVARRGRLMQSMPTGAMLAVALGGEELDAHLSSSSLAVAALNGPAATVVSGELAEIAALAERLAAAEIKTRRLDTSHAFHSPLMDAVVEPFRREVEKVTRRAPERPFFSNLSGRLIRPEEATSARYWADHLRAPVRFGDALAELWREPNRILLEVGPGRALTSLARAHPARQAGALALQSLPHANTEEDDQAFLLTTLGRLWLADVEPDWAGFHGDEKRCRVVLPTYPFERRSYWLSRRKLAAASGESIAAEPVSEVSEESAEESAEESGRPELDTPYVAPRSDDERKIAEIWALLTGIGGIGVYDDFFELGGHSLLATRLVARLGETFGVELPLRDFFRAPHVAGVAELLAERREADPEAGAVLPTIVPDAAGRFEPFPLTEVQEAYWIGRSGALELGGKVATHVYEEIEIEGLDVARLTQAFRRLIDHQAMLRAIVDDEGRQRILPEVPPYEIGVLDLSAVDADAARAGLEAARRHLSHQVHRSDRWPLFELRATRLAHGRLRLHFSFDLLLGDAWSFVVFFTQLRRFYADPTRHEPALELSFRDYVLAERELRRSDAYERALAYWRGRLETLPLAPELPLAKPLEELERPRFVRRSGRLDEAAWTRLKARAGKAGLTPSGVLLAAFGSLLAVWSRHPRFTLNLTLFNRLPMHPEVNELIGDFTSLLLLEVDAAGQEPFEARARRLQARLFEDLDHRLVSGVRVLREMARARGETGQLTMPVVFTSVLGLDEQRPGAGKKAGRREASRREANRLEAGSWAGEGEVLTGNRTSGSVVYSISQTPQVLLDHQVSENGGRLIFNWDVVEAAFPPGVLDQMFDAYRGLLNRLAGDEATWKRPVAGLLPTTHLAGVLAGEDPRDAVPEATLHGLFAERARREPERPAVIAVDLALTYGELAGWSSRLAAVLRQRGARSGQLVAVVLDKGWRQAVATLAILEAGAAYLPIDPALPEERRAYLLAHGEVELALSSPGLAAELAWPDGVEVVAIGEEPPEAVEGAGERVEVSPTDLAYVIFTSGSTGRPKGVMIDHRGAVNTVLDINQRFRVGPEDRVLALSSLGFDLSVYDLFGVLAAGGAVVMPDPATLREPAGWLEAMHRHRVTLWNTAPSLMVMLVEHLEGADERLPAAHRLVLLSGDWIPVSLPDRLRARGGELEIISLGGATEASIWSILYPIAAVDPGWASIPYGRAMRRQAVHVLDADLLPRAPWVPGDLYIGGVGVALGYWRDEERTAASFFAHPLTGERLYRTGDLGRYLPDGNIEFLGREDFQVKIRGHRIELGEIETVLGQVPGVHACAVLAVGPARGDRQLVACASPKPGAALELGEIEAHLKRQLPAACLPSRIVLLDSLPVTANGKLDRTALVELATSRAERPARASGSAPARSQVEELLAELWAEILDVEEVLPEDHFFALGGHSVIAIQLVSRVRKIFGVELPLGELFEAPVLADLARRVAAASAAEAGVLGAPLVALPREGDLPLSFAQQRLWFIDQLEPDNPFYNMPVAWRLGEPLDRDAFVRALAEMVRRHEILRTVFPNRRGAARQEVLPFMPPPLPSVDLSALPREHRERTVAELCAAEARRPFDLARGPLLRALLLRLAGDDHVVFLNLHHIVTDGWSTALLAHELSTLYQAFSAGRPSPLPVLEVQYVDYARWQRGELSGEARERHLAYWRDQLAGVGALELPTDRPRPPRPSFRGRTVGVALSASTTRALRALSRRHGVTLFMTLLAAYQALLARYSGGGDVAVGTPVAGRDRVELEPLIGMFVNTLVLRVAVRGEESFAELVARVREVVLAAHAHQQLPFEMLVEELQPERDLRHTPFFQTILALQEMPKGKAPKLGSAMRSLLVESGTSKLDLTFNLVETVHGLRGTLEYSSDLYDRTTVKRLLGHYEQLLSAVLDASRPLAEACLSPPAERHQLLVEWNDTGVFADEAATLDVLFARRAALLSERVAVVDGELWLSYGELDRRVGELATRLGALGVGRETLAGLLLARSSSMVIATLAVLAAGGAYLPLDPAYPAERLAYMAEDSGLEVLLTVDALADRIPGFAGQVLCLDRLPASAAATALPVAVAVPDQLAYVMYTSASTGRPKGVCAPHRGVRRLVVDASYARFGPGEVFLQAAPMSFDAATLEIWGALLHGARLVLAPAEQVLPAELGELIARERISFLWLTAGLFRQMVEQALPALRGVAQLIAGGDVLPMAEVEAVLRELPGCRLMNGYGPTENTTFTTTAVLERRAHERASAPIGRAIDATRVHVADRRLQALPLGVAGELLAAGDGLARGYLERPARTAAVFVPDPWSAVPGGRLYRTGDLARFLADGELEFLGRLDHQVKLRGFRVEPGEIETALAGHPAIRQAIVVVMGDAVDDKRLAAGVVAEDGQDVDRDELRAFLAARLPGHMVPNELVVLAEMPLTPNGKFDRAAVRRRIAEAAGEETASTAYRAPQTPLEEELAAIWQRVLRRSPIGVDDSFFDLGGHSLLATRILAEVRAAFAVEGLSLRSLFENPTIAGLALEITRQQLEQEDAAEIQRLLAEVIDEEGLAEEPHDEEQLDDERLALVDGGSGNRVRGKE